MPEIFSLQLPDLKQLPAEFGQIPYGNAIAANSLKIGQPLVTHAYR
jgi:hypothetical protein